MNAVVVRLERLKQTKMRVQRQHDLRLYTDKTRPKYINPERTSLNSVIIAPLSRDELLREVERRREGRKRKLKENAVLLFQGLIAFGVEAQRLIESLSREEQDKVFLEVAKAIAQELQTDIESLTVHRDETSIHAHFTVFNHTHDGTTLSRKLNPRKLSEIQDIASQTLKRLGLDIGRGKQKRQRLQSGEPLHKVVHRTVYELHRDLPREIEQRKKELESLGKKYSIEEVLKLLTLAYGDEMKKILIENSHRLLLVFPELKSFFETLQEEPKDTKRPKPY